MLYKLGCKNITYIYVCSKTLSTLRKFADLWKYHRQVKKINHDR